MSVPANRHKGEVALPEAGDGIVLRLSFDAMERLETEYGDNYINLTLQKVNSISPKTIKTLLEVMVQGSDVDFKKEPWKSIPWNMSWADLQRKIGDAIMLAVHGRTMEEHSEFVKNESEDRLDKEWAEAKEAADAGNPRKMAALLSQMSAVLDMARNSSRTISEN